MLIYAPCDICTTVSKTILGIAGIGLSILALGQIDLFNRCANLTCNSKYILPLTYQHIINAISGDETHAQSHTNGLLGSNILIPLFNKAIELSKEESSFFTREFGSRRLFFLGIVVCPLFRALDLIVGIAACISGIVLTIFSTLTGYGKDTTDIVNKFARNQLTFLSVINDISLCIRGIFTLDRSCLEIQDKSIA
jgi:hypothetical protein